MESLRDIVTSQLRSMRPAFFAKKPHFNFITVHYFYVIGLAILGSVLIYGPGRGNLAYIDALAFASGGATQAGLNTVNVNLLTTYQQAVIFVIAGIANPIVIHSFVVLLRLYWFEKRFQHIVNEARLRRGTISKSKSKYLTDPARLEDGVNGRHITVMHNGARSRLANDGTYLGPMASAATDGPSHDHEGANGSAYATGSAANGDTVAPKFTLTEPLESRRPEIKFAPTVKRSDGVDDDLTKIPPRLTDEEHIAILERQRRNQDDDEVLRIPGPRDAERGVLPSTVMRGESGEEDEYASSPVLTHRIRRRSDSSEESLQLDGPSKSSSNKSRSRGSSGNKNNNEQDTSDENRGRQRLQQAITIQEPVKPSRSEELHDNMHAAAHVVSAFRPRRPHGHSNSDDASVNGGNLHQTSSGRSKRRQTIDTFKRVFSRDKEDEPTPYLSWEPTLGRNSAFLGLSEEQREELGGIEYRSLKTLALVLFSYYWGFWLLGVVSLLPWILKNNTYGSIVDEASQSRVWWGFFTPHSAFMDLGFTLTPDSMNSFNTAIFPLLLMAFLIVIGNTGFPVMLRFVIWVLSNIVPRGSGIYEELKFLLDHPRRCFTLLFPSGATWWLFWLLVILNGIDLLFFIVLDLGSGPVFSLPPGIRVLDGLFQAFSTRTAGFSCVNLAEVHPAVQASYMIMMYISVFPIAISVRRTNVYEEKSLGVYPGHEIDEPANGTDLEYVGAHLRRQLSFDLWFLSVGFFILTISEGSKLQANEFQMFAVLFEVVSAYGTVGMSLGYSGGDASLCSQFSVVGKLVIIAMMIRGRHRGLPYGLDRAILLPSESLNEKEAAAAEAELARGVSFMTAATRRGSAVSLPTQGAPTIRGSSMNRERRRSRSIERVNSNLLTQFLHPGPPKHSLHVPQPPRRSFSEANIEEAMGHSSGIDFADHNPQQAQHPLQPQQSPQQ
ncbi:low affinity potassium transporter [Sporothrix bragantina]|uniref:Potassium transport protein n=1 Tax=Sporothrix bragantina TaxID=671064 RepID=A0ABP0C8Z3_9PEZI